MYNIYYVKLLFTSHKCIYTFASSNASTMDVVHITTLVLLLKLCCKTSSFLLSSHCTTSYIAMRSIQVGKCYHKLLTKSVLNRIAASMAHVNTITLFCAKLYVLLVLATTTFCTFTGKALQSVSISDMNIWVSKSPSSKTYKTFHFLYSRRQTSNLLHDLIVPCQKISFQTVSTRKEEYQQPLQHHLQSFVQTTFKWRSYIWK